VLPETDLSMEMNHVQKKYTNFLGDLYTVIELRRSWNFTNTVLKCIEYGDYDNLNICYCILV
jgi:hypothetical protein